MAKPSFNVSAGNFTAAMYFDGSPIWPDIRYRPHGTHEEIKLYGLGVAGLHDLQYIVTRLLAQLPEGCE